MNSLLRILAVLMVLLLLVSVAVRWVYDGPSSAALQDAADALEAQGISVQDAQRVDGVFEAQALAVPTGDSIIYLYSFGLVREAQQARESVSSDGTQVAGRSIEASRFYHDELIMASYDGREPAVLAALTRTFGEQFAGPRDFHACQESERSVDACIAIYQPVCAWFGPDVQCVKAPCAVTVSNACLACQNPDIAYWTVGECPEE